MATAFDAFRGMEQLRREFDRLFDETLGWRGRGPFGRHGFLPGRSARTYPLLNVSDDKDHVYVEALAPGLEPDSLEINVVNNQLSITGVKNSVPKDVKPEAYHRSERAVGRFVRTITLPTDIEQDQAQAEYRQGILTITFPKAEKAKPRQIEVKVD